ncbi:MAG: alpha/beta fold hydrolase [Desulfobacterales bacterium]|nr:alpha/beta fold hydrolase [Desulfobacterales bacterium]
MGILQKPISYPAGDIIVPGILCLPEHRSDSAVVVVLHGSDGFKPNHGEIAMRLANEGFAAVALSWFGGESARLHWKELRADDVVSVVDFLLQLPSVDVDKLGMIGFSRGGGLALIMASMIPQVKAVVNYFGLTAWQGGLEEFGHLPLNQYEPLDFVRHITCPVLSFHGKIDTVVSVANTIELDTACKAYGVDHRHILYPSVNHSFIWPGDKYNHKAHRDSWEKTLAFFKTHLR